MESVDRNVTGLTRLVDAFQVALRMESVDRNFPKYLLVKLCDVAPHTGSVDRNMKFTQ